LYLYLGDGDGIDFKLIIHDNIIYSKPLEEILSVLKVFAQEIMELGMTLYHGWEDIEFSVDSRASTIWFNT